MVECRWLWLDSLFCLCPLCRIIHTTWVYPLTLYPPFFGFYFFNGLLLVLLALHIFWAGLILRMVVKFLPGNVRVAAFNPVTVSPQTATAQKQLLFFLTWQDIVEDERSDKEETESEDEGNDRERREKSKNGHVQNGHTPLNNNRSKTDWLDSESWRWGSVRSEYGPSHAAVTWKPKNGSVACRKRQQAAHTHLHTRISIH